MGKPRATGPEKAGTDEVPLVSVVMPCLNEEETVGACIEKILSTFAANGIDGEIIVADNGSTDKSVEIAKSYKVKVVNVSRKGYGHAYFEGISHARGRYIVIGDSDNTYDFGLIPVFLGKMRDEAFEFVTGSRYLGLGRGERIPIPFLHQYFGNPALTRLLNLLFKTRYTDVYCGLRSFSRSAYDRLRPESAGMEFNLELAINAGLSGLKTAEIPISLAPRKGKSKLASLRDGLRSLKLMLRYWHRGRD